MNENFNNTRDTRSIGGRSHFGEQCCWHCICDFTIWPLCHYIMMKVCMVSIVGDFSKDRAISMTR